MKNLNLFNHLRLKLSPKFGDICKNVIKNIAYYRLRKNLIILQNITKFKIKFANLIKSD